jgi:release factor glutamine methyltransferase
LHTVRTATTLDQALLEAKAMGLARLDAQLLLLHAVGRRPSERAWLLAHGGDVLESHAWALWQTLRDRRAAGEPMAYILGWAAFYGLDLLSMRAYFVHAPTPKH